MGWDDQVCVVFCFFRTFLNDFKRLHQSGDTANLRSPSSIGTHFSETALLYYLWAQNGRVSTPADILGFKGVQGARNRIGERFFDYPWLRFCAQLSKTQGCQIPTGENFRLSMGETLGGQISSTDRELFWLKPPYEWATFRGVPAKK